MTVAGKRTITDTEARGKAIQFMADSLEVMVGEGDHIAWGHDEDWTDADVRAVTKHIYARIEGMRKRNG